MPYRAKTPCSQHGCPELTDQRYCDQHRRERYKQYNRWERPTEHAERYGSQWRKIREQYLATNILCVICQSDGLFRPANTVHHKQRLNAGGTNDYQNLQALCSACHSRLHAAERDYFGKGGQR